MVAEHFEIIKKLFKKFFMKIIKFKLFQIIKKFKYSVNFATDGVTRVLPNEKTAFLAPKFQQKNLC